MVARLQDCTGWQHHWNRAREELISALLCAAVHRVDLVLRGRHLDRAVGQGNGAGPIDGSVPWLNVSIRHCVGLLAALEVQQMGEFLLLIHR